MSDAKPDRLLDGLLDVFYDIAAAALADLNGDEDNADDYLRAARTQLQACSLPGLRDMPVRRLMSGPMAMIGPLPPNTGKEPKWN